MRRSEMNWKNKFKLWILNNNYNWCDKFLFIWRENICVNKERLEEIIFASRGIWELDSLK